METNKYHPCSKEFQEDAKKLGLTGNQLIKKYIEEGKLPNPTNIKRKVHMSTIKNAGFDTDKEYKDFLAERRGYDDNADFQREWKYDTGRQSSRSKNANCPAYTGIYVGEEILARQILSMIFEEYRIMVSNNYGFDFICKNPRKEFLNRYPTFKFDHGKGYHIDIKTVNLEHRKDGWVGYHFGINHNNKPDYFLLIGLCHYMDKIDILHIWLFKKDEIIRDIEFWKFINFSITNKLGKMLELSTYELRYELEKLKKGDLVPFDMTLR